MLPFHSRKQVARFKFSVSYLKEKQKENPKNALKQKRDVLRGRNLHQKSKLGQPYKVTLNHIF
jgi:hypothetical protein